MRNPPCLLAAFLLAFRHPSGLTGVMKKGCGVTLLLLGVLVIGGLYFGVNTYSTPKLLWEVEQTIAEYRELYPDQKVELTNPAWCKALTAADSSVKRKDRFQQIFPGGEFVDPYQTPLRLLSRPDGAILCVSAGPDRKFDTPDDQTSDRYVKLFDKLGKLLEKL